MRYGRVSNSINKRSVLKYISRNDDKIICGAGGLSGCAILAHSDNTALYSAVAYREGSTVGTAACACTEAVAKLEAGGIRCEQVTASLVLPADAQESFLKELVRRLDEACREANSCLVRCEVHASERVSVALAHVTAAGHGVKPACAGEGGIGAAGRGWSKTELYGVSLGAADMDIVMTKYLAYQGTCMLAEIREEELRKYFPAFMTDRVLAMRQKMSVLPEAAVAMKFGAGLCQPVVEGGIFAALWDLSERLGTGLKINMRSIPVMQETIEICEKLSVNPYELDGTGSLLIITDRGEALARELRSSSISAAVIGKTTDNNDKLLINEEELRYLDKPGADSLFKLYQTEDRI